MKENYKHTNRVHSTQTMQLTKIERIQSNLHKINERDRSTLEYIRIDDELAKRNRYSIAKKGVPISITDFTSQYHFDPACQVYLLICSIAA